MIFSLQDLYFCPDGLQFPLVISLEASASNGQ